MAEEKKTGTPFFNIEERGEWKKRIKDNDTGKFKYISSTYKYILDETGAICGIYTTFKAAKMAIPNLKKKLAKILGY